ncbi:hypothetical protein ACTXGQ_27890, partial [Marinobacter sp. 1Y8]
MIFETVAFHRRRVFSFVSVYKIMALSSFFRSSPQTKQASGSDGVLSMPSARAILLSSVGCMMVLSLLMVASA